MKCVYVREMRLCEKRKGDRIKSGGCAKFACLRSKSFQTGPCLCGAGLLTVIGIW